jgi:hypothetical protein
MPSIAFGQPAWLDTVLEAVETRISAAAGIPRSRVFTFAGDAATLLESPPAEQFAAVWFDSLQVEQDLLIGGGPENTGFDDVLTVTVFQRLTTDRENTDANLLRSRSLGFATTLKKIGKALQGWFPTVGDTSILREPCRVLALQLRGRQPAHGWAMATVRVSARFVADLSGE